MLVVPTNHFGVLFDSLVYNRVYVTEVFPDLEFLFEDFVSALYFFDSLAIKLGSEDLKHPKPGYSDYRVSMYDNDK